MKISLLTAGAFFKGMIAVILTTVSLPLHSQEAEPGSKKLWGGFGHFNFSGEQLNIGDLNRSLAANGYDQLHDATASYGGGGAFIIHNFVVGGNGAWLLGSGTRNAGNETKLSGGYGFFNAGYVVYSGKHGVLYPTLGIGGGGYDISFSKLNSSTDFNQQLSSPSGMITAKAGGLITTIQVSYQYFFCKHALEGFYLGLKGGYKYSPTSWKVSVNDQELINSPKINMDGFFVTLYFGGGSLTNINKKNN